MRGSFLAQLIHLLQLTVSNRFEHHGLPPLSGRYSNPVRHTYSSARRSTGRSSQHAEYSRSSRPRRGRQRTPAGVATRADLALVLLTSTPPCPASLVPLPPPSTPRPPPPH